MACISTHFCTHTTENSLTFRAFQAVYENKMLHAWVFFDLHRFLAHISPQNTHIPVADCLLIVD